MLCSRASIVGMVFVGVICDGVDGVGMYVILTGSEGADSPRCTIGESICVVCDTWLMLILGGWSEARMDVIIRRMWMATIE